MGGKALKNTFMRSYQDKEYKALVAELVPILTKALSTEVVPTIPYGDMDLLVKMPTKLDNRGISDFVKNQLQSKDTKLRSKRLSHNSRRSTIYRNYI